MFLPIAGKGFVWGYSQARNLDELLRWVADELAKGWYEGLCFVEWSELRLWKPTYRPDLYY